MASSRCHHHFACQCHVTHDAIKKTQRNRLHGEPNKRPAFSTPSHDERTAAQPPRDSHSRQETIVDTRSGCFDRRIISRGCLADWPASPDIACFDRFFSIRFRDAIWPERGQAGTRMGVSALRSFKHRGSNRRSSGYICRHRVTEDLGSDHDGRHGRHRLWHGHHPGQVR